MGSVCGGGCFGLITCNASRLPGRVKVDLGVPECITCFACGDSWLKIDGKQSLQCTAGHVLCPDCICTWAMQDSQDGLVHYPPKCAMCGSPYHMDTAFKDAVGAEVAQRFEECGLQAAKAAAVYECDEILIACQHCSFAEVRDVEGMMFIWCQNERCRKVSCVVCHADCTDWWYPCGVTDICVPRVPENLLLAHSHCAQIAHLIFRVRGGVQPRACPACRVPAIKDENCTKITCVCGVCWCYVCSQLLDPERPYLHYDPADESGFFSPRCALFLNQYHEVEPDRWSADEQVAAEQLEVWHKHRCLNGIYMDDPNLFEELIRSRPQEISGLELDAIRNGVPALPLLATVDAEIDLGHNDRAWAAYQWRHDGPNGIGRVRTYLYNHLTEEWFWEDEPGDWTMFMSEYGWRWWFHVPDERYFWHPLDARVHGWQL